VSRRGQIIRNDEGLLRVQGGRLHVDDQPKPPTSIATASLPLHAGEVDLAMESPNFRG